MLINNFRRAAAPCNKVFDYEDPKTLKLYEDAYNAEVYRSHQYRIRQNKRISQRRQRRSFDDSTPQVGDFVTNQTWHLEAVMRNPKKLFNFTDFVTLTENGLCPPAPLQGNLTDEYVREEAQKLTKHHFQPALYYKMNEYYHGFELRFPMTFDSGDYACG